jgi:hypothetical protein
VIVCPAALRLRVPDWEQVKVNLVSGDAISVAFEEAMRLDNFEGPESAA